MEPKLQLERVVRGRDQEPRPCVLSCLAVSTARTPAGAQLRTAGHRVRSRAAAGTASVDTRSEPCGCCAHDGQPPPGPREAARAGQCTFAFQGPPGRQQAGPALPTALTRQRGVPQPHPAQRRGERPLGGPSSARARGGSGTFVCPQTGFERVGLWGVLSSVFSCLVRSVFINDVQRP